MYQNLPLITLVLESDAPEAQQRAQHIATALHTTVNRQEPAETLRLVVNDDRVELRGAEAVSARGVYVDFSSLNVRPGQLSRRQPLAKAMGRESQSVVDATAGMGHDAFLLACLGFEVLAVERSPIVAILLEDGLRRAEADARLDRMMGGRLRIVQGDAREVLSGLEAKPDVVYMDPMFPPKRRASALPRKEIQLLRQVVGDDPDADQLFAAAMAVASRRVVVKRPTYAPPLAADPTVSFPGKLVRYDVYVRRSAR